MADEKAKKQKNEKTVPAFLAVAAVLLASYFAFCIGEAFIDSALWPITFQSYDSVGMVVLSDDGQYLTENANIDTRLYSKFFKMAGEYPELQQVIENYTAYPESLINMFVNNPETLETLLLYPEWEKHDGGAVLAEELEGAFPQIMQTDPRWAYGTYGDGIMAVTGCGPTSISAVAMHLTGNTTYNPAFVANVLEKTGYYWQGTGTSWEAMTEGAKLFDINGEELMLDENAVKAAVQNGLPVVCSMKKGDFTSGAGHFIIITGADENGGLKVHDPASKANSAKTWQFDDIKGQIKNLWVFRANG